MKKGNGSKITTVNGSALDFEAQLWAAADKMRGPINKPFLYQLLRSHEYRAEIVGGATGTTVKRTSPGRIKAFKFILPDSKRMQDFGEVTGAWHALIAENCKQSRTLAALRDARLPKLLSGQIRMDQKKDEPA